MDKIKVNNVIKHITIAIISLVFLSLTLFVPVTVSNKIEMSSVQLGYPFHFVVQNITQYDPPFPWKYGLQSLLECPIKVVWGNLFLSYAIIFLILEIIVFVFVKLNSKKQQD